MSINPTLGRDDAHSSLARRDCGRTQPWSAGEPIADCPGTCCNRPRRFEH